MCRTTTPPRPASQKNIHDFPPNTTAGAVTPLLAYLMKYVTKFGDELIPDPPPTLPSDVNPDEYKHVPLSLWPLRKDDVSPYYAGVNDDDTDFSASLLKAAALYAAGQLHADALAALPGATNSSTFLSSFKAALKARVDSTADSRILSKHFPSGSPVGLYPNITNVLKFSGFGSPTGPKVDFTDNYKTQMSAMIVQSSDPAAAFCIDQLGYGYISTVLIERQFFITSASRGIWLAGDYANPNTYIRIPVMNDHPDAQNTTSRQMCRLFALIRLKKLPENDPDANTLMQNLLHEPKTGPDHTGPWLSPGRNPGTDFLFTVVADKIGFAGLGTGQTPNVYSEGLIISWDDDDQVDAFNKRIDPDDSHPEIHLSGEIAVCWQNYLADSFPDFRGIIKVINKSISDFLDQKTL